MLQAVAAWAAALKWIPAGRKLPHGAKHLGTSWAELLLDSELTIGLETPSLHRPRAGSVKDEGVDEPDNLGIKARAPPALSKRWSESSESPFLLPRNQPEFVALPRTVYCRPLAPLNVPAL